ncbi:hypothetical protein MRX96_058157 [Rhipicephalus microplus]
MPGYDPAVVGIADGQNAPDGLCVDACGFLAKPQALPVDVADVARKDSLLIFLVIMTIEEERLHRRVKATAM